MNRKWSIFILAVSLAGYLLLSHGAPPLAVAAGIGGAALFTWRRPRID